MTETPLSAEPPETMEGWYSLHQIYRRIPGALADADEDAVVGIDFASLARGEGWSAMVTLIGSTADFMLIHFRPTLEEIADVRDEMSVLFAELPIDLVYCFLSVTEAGLYSAKSEREGPHVRRRLYPPLPADMPYVCFYPMSKRRDAGQNWYTLPLAERARMMQAHGVTGRKYAGRVQQIITGAIGFDRWEWGVTLFAKDPLDFKKLVTEMRFDEVSAKYAEFGDFYVGTLRDPRPGGGA